jgi:hypothetical protein
MQQGQPPFKIEMDEEQGQGIYSNMVMITHSPSEFILDFARVMPGIPKAKVHARIVMTPQHAKLLLKALEENIKKYENRFGEIKLHGMEEKKVGFVGTDEVKT